MQLTIRRVDPEWVKTAKRKAARKGVSMNQFILDAIKMEPEKALSKRGGPISTSTQATPISDPLGIATWNST